VVSSLQPRQLHARFVVQHPSREPAQAEALQLRDATDKLLRMGVRPAHIVGQLWGLKVEQGAWRGPLGPLGPPWAYLATRAACLLLHQAVLAAGGPPRPPPPPKKMKTYALRPPAGELVQLELELHNSGDATQQLELSLACLDLGGAVHGGSLVTSPRVSQTALGSAGGALLAAAGPLVHPGVVLTGCSESVALEVDPGDRAVHRFGAVVVQPGFYQFYVAGVRVAGEGGKVQVTVDPLNVLCV
jgi:hypothetical protein